MYKIAYIDESERDRHDFQDYVKYAPNSADFVLDALEPLPNLKEFAQILIESHYQAVVIDFDLSEKNRLIHYKGSDLANEILAIRESFPVFVLTSYEDAALMKVDDVNQVYDKKSIVHKEDNLFLERIKYQIKKFEQRITEAENRLLELTNLSKKRPLDVYEEEELIRLDSRIEKSLNKGNKIPDNIKTLSSEKRLDKIIELLDKVDKTIQKANNKK